MTIPVLHSNGIHVAQGVHIMHALASEKIDRRDELLHATLCSEFVGMHVSIL